MGYFEFLVSQYFTHRRLNTSVFELQTVKCEEIMSIFIRVIAVTAICGIGLISKLNSIHIITAYEEYVEKSFNNNFTEICQPANRMVGVIVSISHWANGKMVITYQTNQICTQSHDPKNCSQSGDRLLKVLQKQITYQSVTNATVNIAYPEPNHEGLTLSYLLLKVYQVS